MDGGRFDQWTRLLGTAGWSRRGVARLAAGSGLAMLELRLGETSASACRKDGRQCDPEKKKEQCCSGRCKKTKNGGGRCRPIRSAKGCTIKDDTCKVTGRFACPGDPDRFCLVLDSGKPFCAEDGTCVDCDNDRDCTRLGNGTPGKCLTTCGACDEESNGRACVFANVPESMVPGLTLGSLR